MTSPKVTVLMSVYNGEKYLREAIDSILNQTFEDYEFLIIDDGSTDGTAAILGSYHDLRMKVVRNEENMGLTKSLNKGLTIAKGGYIARMDADDISLPERLQKQVEYLEAHPEIGVVGTWADYTDEHGASRGAWRFPTEPALVGWWIILGGFCLAHPSVMMRFDVIKRLGFYDPEAIYAQDCELWTRANSVTRLANIPEVLLRYRYQEKSIRARHSQEQWQAVVNSMRPVIMRLIGSDVPVDMVWNLRRLATGSKLTDLEQIERVASLIQKLFLAYLRTNSANGREMKEVTRDAGRKLYTLALSASNTSLWKGLVILVRALRIDPLLLPTLCMENVRKGVGKGVRIVRGGSTSG